MQNCQAWGTATYKASNALELDTPRAIISVPVSARRVVSVEVSAVSEWGFDSRTPSTLPTGNKRTNSEATRLRSAPVQPSPPLGSPNL